MEQQVEKITPYGENCGGKTAQVRSMFDSIAPAYDFLNRAMTFGLDKMWRKKAVAIAKQHHPSRLLDIATGTGDLAVALARAMPQLRVTGVDISTKMLEVAQRKIDEANLQSSITLQCADGTQLPFPDNSFDTVTIAYGIRNFDQMQAGYSEMLRVLDNGGQLIVLELATPVGTLTKFFYNLYAKGIIPLLGRLISHDARAYSYLPESIAAVPQRHVMTELMTRAGFRDCHYKELTFGTCIIYTAFKKSCH